MVPFRYEEFIKDLLSLVESGEIPIARIDDAVERILRVKFVAGLFEHPFSDRSLIDVVGCKASFQCLWYTRNFSYSLLVKHKEEGTQNKGEIVQMTLL